MPLQYKQPAISYQPRRPRALSSASDISVPSSLSAPDAATVHPDWHDTALDTLLVASDGVFFYVSRTLLHGSSEVLRDIFDSIPTPSPESPYRPLSKVKTKPKPPPQQRIDLTDPYESSVPLAFFLAILTGTSLSKIRRKFPRKQVQTFHLALTLVDKWKSPLVKGVMQGWLCELAMGGYDDEQFRPYEVFVLAAKAGMPTPARMVLEELSESPPHTLPTPFKPITDQYWHYTFTPENTWDYNQWSRGVWEEIGVKYLFAMKEALKCEGRKKRGEVFMKALEDDFYDPMAPETPKATPLRLRFTPSTVTTPVRVAPVSSSIKSPKSSKRKEADKYIMEFIEQSSSVASVPSSVASSVTSSEIAEKSHSSRSEKSVASSSDSSKVQLRGTLVIAKK
ncbi:hypothetical protein L198_00438 [Cryptococcus wingfieldii CBS 7118]|uniref:BTB domain-containing protein n=1 Tax=Cryptococcus wingfieldii CBS 7118 TaxID=1295528 RepID=A0A1E3K6T2_9TREE|nr:hypothetical protein L198_00438 [Cryptococcus wingfieldii CBS 7118]ODO08705.1 hypothetical protein L198_00438 [Cryptococcus wingfieldii CBS 7118]